MEELTDKRFSEMISLLLDGELDSTQEAVLYENLAKNEELQTELRELIAIRETVKNDTEAFTPPTNASSNVFQKLGLNLPVTVSLKSIADPLKSSGVSTFFKKYWPVMLLLLLGVTATSVYVANNIISKSPDLASNVPVVSSTESTGDNTVSNTGDNTKISPAEANTNKPSADSKQSFASKAIAIPAAQATKTQAGTSDETKIKSPASSQTELDRSKTATEVTQLFIKEITASKANVPANKVNSTDLVPNFNYRPTHSFIAYSPNLYNPESDIVAEPSKKNITLHVRGLVPLTTIQSEFNPSQNSALNNLCLGVYFIGGEDWKLGMETGLEPFGNIYLSGDGGSSVPFTQNPVWWVGVAGRWDVNEWALLNCHPFAELVIGGSSPGAIAKGMLGFEYISKGEIIFPKGFGMSFGYDGSVIFNSNNNKLNLPTKSNLLLGVSYRF